MKAKKQPQGFSKISIHSLLTKTYLMTTSKEC